MYLCERFPYLETQLIQPIERAVPLRLSVTESHSRKYVRSFGEQKRFRHGLSGNGFVILGVSYRPPSADLLNSRIRCMAGIVTAAA